MRTVYHRFALSNPALVSASSKKSFSCASCPIFAWRVQHRQAETQGTTRAVQRAEAAELTHVKRELARVTQERDFLKRAAAFFARESQ